MKQDDIDTFKALLHENRYDFVKLAYLIFPFGEKGTELEDYSPYEWQVEEWQKLSNHLSNIETRYKTYRLIISSGNGSAKTAWGAMTMIMLLFTQRLKGRITANTDPQMKTIVWPEYDIWFRRARFVDHFFEKFGTSIKARNPKLAESWRIDTVTWSEQAPASISGLHNKGGAAVYVFEEAPGIPAVIWEYASGAFTETETDRRLYFSSWYSDSPMGFVEGDRKVVYWPYPDKVFEYNLAMDSRENNPLKLSDEKAERIKQEILKWQYQSQIMIDAKRYTEDFLYSHWRTFSVGRSAWAYYVP